MSVVLWQIGALFAIQVVFIGHAALRWSLARRLGLQVARARFGWGPTLWSRTTSAGTRIEIRALPPLAMVAVAGHDPAAGSPSYRELHGRSDLGKRVLLTLASPAYYVLLTVLTLFAIVLVAGWPETVTRGPVQVGEIRPDSPAEAAGIEPDDMIVDANGQPVRTAADLIRIVSSRGGIPTRLDLRRGDHSLSVTVTPVPGPNGRAFIGVAPRLDTVLTRRRLGVLEAGSKAWTLAWTRFEQNVSATIALFQPHTGEVMGPVAMSAAIADESSSRDLEFAIALVSVFLVRFWLLVWLPVPFCAGGRLILLIPEALGRRQPSARTERWMTGLAGGLYISLVALVTLQDLTGL